MKKKLGRKVFTLTCCIEDFDIWKTEAKKDGRTLSGWVNYHLNKVIKNLE